MSHFSNECQLYQFADDTCLISADHNIDVALNNLQEDFNNISKWCHDAGLVLNSIKTKLINIRSPYLKSAETVPKLIAHTHACMHDNRDICDCPHIEVVKSHTYLGLVIDNRFNWGAHVQRDSGACRAMPSCVYCEPTVTALCDRGAPCLRCTVIKNPFFVCTPGEKYMDECDSCRCTDGRGGRCSHQHCEFRALHLYAMKLSDGEFY
ncbi:unnamed protein product [Plutella xylostella]|uniref:(diamondback moth) hypothetical protein n=1 Tax=Plutella xylostella TaxID=51655 RepID=A0A8S4G7Y6_PLUXY|nr:unnamed protein product [Plutella xylostella]